MEEEEEKKEGLETTEEKEETQTQEGDPAETNENLPKTQAEFDAVLKQRLKRERKKYGDYDELKEKAAKLTEIEEAQKTAEQKLKEENEKLKKQSEEREAQVKEGLKVQTIKAKAEALGFEDPDYAFFKLQQNDDIIVNEDYEVEGVDEALKELAEANPTLTKKGQKQKITKATKPGDNAMQGESMEQRRNRVYGLTQDVFDPDKATAHGGGVVFPGQSNE